MEIFIGEREKWSNKGNGKQEEADSLLHNTTNHTQFRSKFQNPKCGSSWEIFDEKKVYTHTHTKKQTNTHTHTNIADSEQSSILPQP